MSNDIQDITRDAERVRVAVNVASLERALDATLEDFCIGEGLAGVVIGKTVITGRRVDLRHIGECAAELAAYNLEAGVVHAEREVPAAFVARWIAQAEANAEKLTSL